MKRTTVFLDEALERRLKQRARREGKSFAQCVREAVAAYVAAPPRRAGTLPSWVGMGDSGRSDIASHPDDFLWTDPHR
jgi:predicted transcriptional regulator